MTRIQTLILTAIAPVIWGSSYIVATEFLPNVDPATISLMRALPAGLLLLVFVRQLPKGIWIGRMLVLGALNFSIFWSLMFLAAHRLPGGVAATVGALQPFVVVFAARGLLGTPIRPLFVIATLVGALGVALLILTPDAQLDMLGVAAGVLGAVSMAFGTVLSRKWKPSVSTLTFTAWQLVAGGVLLIPMALFNGALAVDFTTDNLFGLAYLGLIGAALTYVIWLNGIAKIHPTSISLLGLLSPLSATFLGWVFLTERLSLIQAIGAILVLSSVVFGQYVSQSRGA